MNMARALTTGRLVRLSPLALEDFNAVGVTFSENLFRVVDRRRSYIKVAPVSATGLRPNHVLSVLAAACGEELVNDVDHTRAIEVFAEDLEEVA